MRGAPYGAAEREILSHERFAEARREIMSWPGYEPTPMHVLTGLARSAGLGAILCKDESHRFGLNAFKALGGAYAVERLLARLIRERAGVDAVSSSQLMAGTYREIVSEITVTSATAGNHGRSVAWGANMFGCRCIIYIPSYTSAHREEALLGHGAEVVRMEGNYDEAVRRCDADARRLGRLVVSDTSYPGYMEIPKDVMQGYTVMAAEMMEQLAGRARPTHVFLQGGVGGFAAAVCAHLWEAWGVERPIFLVVEPDSADCLYRSAQAGVPTPVSGEYETIMTGLAAGEVSALAWRILSRCADHFMTIPDAAAEAAMRTLAEPAGDDPPIVAGESAVAGLAAALIASSDAPTSHRLRLGAEARVLVIGTEGATDPESYRRIVGRSAEEVVAGG